MKRLKVLAACLLVSGASQAAVMVTGDVQNPGPIPLPAGGRLVDVSWVQTALGEAYDKQIKSDIADMKNVGGRPGGAITAAQFIQRFVSGKPWVHLDIAGTAWATKDSPTCPKGATAFGVRLLDRFVAAHYEG